MGIKQVKWRDSNLYITQTDGKNLEVSILESVGYVVEDDEDKIVLAGDLIDNEYRRVIVIPKENIII